MSISTALKGASLLKKFVDEELPSILTQISMTAAAEALTNSRQAVDKRSQIWSAINHLEFGVTAMQAIDPSRTDKLQYYLSLDKTTTVNKLDHLVSMLGLLALCYYHIGETNLSEKTISRMELIHKRFVSCCNNMYDNFLHDAFSFTFDLINPRSIYKHMTSSDESSLPIKMDHVSEFADAFKKAYF